MKKPKRVLIVHPFGIGDALFITPVIRALHEAGAHRIDLLLGSRTRALFECHPFVSKIYEWDKSRIQGVMNRAQKIGFFMQLFWRLFRNRYQVMLDFSLTTEYSLLGLVLFWIPMRIGFKVKKRGTFLNRSIRLSKAFSDKHVSEYYLDLLQFIDVQPQTKQFDFFLSDDDRKQAQSFLEPFLASGECPFIVVAPGGGESWGKDARLKQWPVSHFAELTRKVHAELNGKRNRIFILGGPNDHILGKALASELRELEAINLVGKIPIRISAAVIEKSLCFIGNDGGLVHIAAAFKRPLISIYGPVDPKVYGPYPQRPDALSVTNTGPECRPCYQNLRYQADCIHVECLTYLQPKRVLDVMRSAGFFDRLTTGVGIS
jgi:lipopolysaccharide heptosyltransferase II